MSSHNYKAQKHPRATLEYPLRLDLALVKQNLAYSRSRAEEYIRSGFVHVNGLVQKKPGFIVKSTDKITIKVPDDYVSRAGLKLASVTTILKLNFEQKVVLDVGSSTGGFTELAIRRGAKKVIAVDVGTDQLHPKLQGHSKIELHEKTDIRDFKPDVPVDIVLIDVSFISVRLLLPHIAKVVPKTCQIVVMLKPQFEAGKNQVNKGVIKNDTVRRQILREFEIWSKKLFIITAKADSAIAGAKGNVERFYLLKKI